MKEFVYKPDGFRTIRARQIRLLIVMFVLMFLLAGVVPVFFNPDKLTTLPYMVVTMAIVGAFVTANSVSKQRTLYKSFKLNIDDHKLVLSRKGLPDLTILRSDIQSISKRSSGNLVIRGKNQYYTIYIFPFIERQSELENILTGIQPIRILKPNVNVFWFLPGALAVTAAMASMALTDNRIVRIVSLAVLAIVLAMGFHVTQVNRKVDRTTQILSWGILIPLVVFICYMLFQTH